MEFLRCIKRLCSGGAGAKFSRSTAVRLLFFVPDHILHVGMSVLIN